MPDNIPQPANDPDDERRPSWSFVPILVLYIIIAVLVPYLGKISAVLVLLLLGFTLWSALSKKEYEKTRKSYPNYPRGDYIWNSIMHHVVFPWVIILIMAGIAYFI